MRAEVRFQTLTSNLEVPYSRVVVLEHQRHQRMIKMKMRFLFLCLFVTGCVGIPKGIKPVDDFKVDRYLGKWHEIARLDHSFERGLTQVSAEYSLREDVGVKVVNRGYSEKKKAWKSVEGKAYFVNAKDSGFLKVSFFGPFYGSYVIFDLDHENYQHALVCGPDKSYLWILARERKLSPEIQNALVAKAKAAGFDTDKLIYLDAAAFQ